MSANYKIDDSGLFDSLDEILANIDPKVLEQAKLELSKEGKDTSIVNKAINERKRRDKRLEIIEKRKKQEEKRQRKMMRGALLMGLFDGLFGDSKPSSNNDLMPWEEDAKKNEGYEDHNFEEEELEEDDYYYDDDKN